MTTKHLWDTAQLALPPLREVVAREIDSPKGNGSREPHRQRRGIFAYPKCTSNLQGQKNGRFQHRSARLFYNRKFPSCSDLKPRASHMESVWLQP